jgi:hypothetical protein
MTAAYTIQKSPRAEDAMPVAAHLTLDPEWDRLSVIEFGSVWDGQPDDHFGALSSDERLQVLFRQAGGPVSGFMVHQPWLRARGARGPRGLGRPPFRRPAAGAA